MTGSAHSAAPVSWLHQQNLSAADALQVGARLLFVRGHRDKDVRVAPHEGAEPPRGLPAPVARRAPQLRLLRNMHTLA